METHHFYHLKRETPKSIPLPGTQTPCRQRSTEPHLCPRGPQGPREWCLSPSKPQPETDFKNSRGLPTAKPSSLSGLPREFGYGSRSSALCFTPEDQCLLLPSFPTTGLWASALAPTFPLRPFSSAGTWRDCFLSCLSVFESLFSKEKAVMLTTVQKYRSGDILVENP